MAQLKDLMNYENTTIVKIYNFVANLFTSLKSLYTYSKHNIIELIRSTALHLIALGVKQEGW